jgi:hypothetical protein
VTSAPAVCIQASALDKQKTTGEISSSCAFPNSCICNGLAGMGTFGLRRMRLDGQRFPFCIGAELVGSKRPRRADFRERSNIRECSFVRVSSSFRMFVRLDFVRDLCFRMLLLSKVHCRSDSSIVHGQFYHSFLLHIGVSVFQLC